ncbi:MAG: Hsp70 family protein [Pseudomonadota bacterium]
MSNIFVGIDLGTTHSVMARYYVSDESTSEIKSPEVIDIPQLIQAGEISAESQLPSFLYRPHAAEFSADLLTLPWGEQTNAIQPNAIIGTFAREQGLNSPLRLVSSAKSWLSVDQWDRRSAFLPLNAPDDVELCSPFDASCFYLDHLRQAWNDQYPDQLLENLPVVLTVPASFDPAARELTAQAAKKVGLENVTLLEEPQAAVYSWIASLGRDWRQQLTPGDILLVIDVGGGTTDLSLVLVDEKDGNLELERIAVGDHILLGGDNMDLALAYSVTQKLQSQGQRIEPWQIIALSRACRLAKEKLLSQTDIQSVPVSVPTRGSKLLGGVLRSEVTRAELEQTLLEGFFPWVDQDAQPLQAPRQALQQMGLPYAQDAAITRHIAGFLAKHTSSLTQRLADLNAAEPTQRIASLGLPTAVLLNGGVFKSVPFVQRIMQQLSLWAGVHTIAAPRLLDGANLDLAVAQGAAYFGAVKTGQGVRIRGGLASSFYVGVASALPAVPGMPPMVEALCVAPFGLEEGQMQRVNNRTFGLIRGQAVRFQFYDSKVRRDAVGEQLSSWSMEELNPLPDIQVTIPQDFANETTIDSTNNKNLMIPVYLQAELTAVGTLRLEAVPVKGGKPWQLELDVRQQMV